MAAPHAGQLGIGHPSAEEGHGRLVRTILVRRVHQLMRYREPNGVGSGGLEDTAPPVRINATRLHRIRVELEALDDDQQMWIHGQNGVSGSLGGQSPVGCFVLSPAIWCPGRALVQVCLEGPGAGRRSVRLVAKVDAHDCRIPLVALRQTHPIPDPGSLGVAPRVPEAVFLGYVPAPERPLSSIMRRSWRPAAVTIRSRMSSACSPRRLGLA
jgi:hypothetical protein